MNLLLKNFNSQLIKFICGGLWLLLSSVESTGQVLQPSTQCANEPNAQQVFQTAGIARLKDCNDPLPGQYEYQVVFGRSGQEHTVSIYQYTGQLSYRNNSLYWFESAPKTFYLRGANMKKLELNEVPQWAISIMSDNRGDFSRVIEKSGIALPPIQDDPKARGRSARVM